MFWNITKLMVTPSSCFFNKYYNFCCWCISLSKKKNTQKRPWRSICDRIPQDPSDSKKRIAEKKGALLTIMQMASWFKPWPLFPNTGGHQQPLKVTKNCQAICVFETGLQKPFIHSCNMQLYDEIPWRNNDCNTNFLQTWWDFIISATFKTLDIPWNPDCFIKILLVLL